MSNRRSKNAIDHNTERCIDSILNDFADMHTFNEMKELTSDLGCRTFGRTTSLTRHSYAIEMTKALKSLRSAIVDVIDETEQFLMMGEFEPETEKLTVDDSWVQFCERNGRV